MTSESCPGAEVQTDTISIKEAISSLLNGKVINMNSTITCMFDDSLWVAMTTGKKKLKDVGVAIFK
jgi:hypothetical protein